VAVFNRLRRRPPAPPTGGHAIVLDSGRAELVLNKLQLLITRKLDGLLRR